MTIKYLNINTAFLISIILGNGINSPIILLGRYGEERQAGKPVTAALATAMTTSLTGIFAAVAAASVAYGCLLVTSFRGFNQFGLLGGAGMLLVGLMTFVLVPPLVIFGERRWPGAFTPRRNLWRIPFSWIGELAAQEPAAAGADGARRPSARRRCRWSKWAKDPLEWNLEKLRDDESPSQKLWKTMEQLGMGDVGAGYIGNNGVLLVDKPEQADAVAHGDEGAGRGQGAEATCSRKCAPSTSMLPKHQAEKLEMLARIRRKIDKHDEHDERRRAAKEAQSGGRRTTCTCSASTSCRGVVREAFTETDGQRGRLIGIDVDHTTYYDWNGHDLLRMSPALTVDALGQTWVAASAATVFAGMLETIIADGPRVTMCGGHRRDAAGAAPRSGCAGRRRCCSPSASAWCGWAGSSARIALKLNFMNFVALPITLGVGADYAANIWARCAPRAPGGVKTVIAETGSAVALCSLTTIIGYSSLLLSRNRALRSFGLSRRHRRDHLPGGGAGRAAGGGAPVPAARAAALAPRRGSGAGGVQTSRSVTPSSLAGASCSTARRSGARRGRARPGREEHAVGGVLDQVDVGGAEHRRRVDDDVVVAGLRQHLDGDREGRPVEQRPPAVARLDREHVQVLREHLDHAPGIGRLLLVLRHLHREALAAA